ncbi:MAG: oxidoreductase [Actinomycetia bacterium]|nr:oxidoreductase [Actinomycetes bacterium]
MQRVGVGIVGSGFAATLHIDAWRRVAGVEVDVVSVTSSHAAHADTFANRHHIPRADPDLDTLLADPAIDIVDCCVPNYLHATVALRCLEAGRHVVVEKPLTGAFVDPAAVPASAMLEQALSAADDLVRVAAEQGRLLCYAENWVYAPSVEKARRLLAASGGTILRIRGEESHSGTHSEPNKRWETAGGGALLGKGSHPLGAALHLKREEGMARERRPISPRSVVAEVASLTKVPSFAAEPEKFLRTGYHDVEDWGALLVTFDDGTVAEITAGDTTLGGVRNTMTVFASNVVVEMNLNPNTAVRAYAPSPDVLAGEYLSEKLETHGGWSFPSPDEDWMQGYPQEMQDFAECVAHGRSPRSDGGLGRDVLAVIYSGYVSAREGRRVDLSPWFAG